MKSVIYAFCLSLGLFTYVPLAANAQDPAEHKVSPENAALPQLFLEEPMFDAGEVEEGTRVSHDFTVLNLGNAVLQIHRVSTG